MKCLRKRSQRAEPWPEVHPLDPMLETRVRRTKKVGGASRSDRAFPFLGMRVKVGIRQMSTWILCI